MRQSAEWGMRAFQSSFSRLKDEMFYEKTEERKLMSKMCILSCDFEARRVGIDQISNTCMPELNVDANATCVPSLTTEYHHNLE